MNRFKQSISIYIGVAAGIFVALSQLFALLPPQFALFAITPAYARDFIVRNATSSAVYPAPVGQSRMMRDFASRFTPHLGGATGAGWTARPGFVKGWYNGLS